MARELTIGILAVVLALFMIVQVESQKIDGRDDVIEINIDREKAQFHIKNKMGKDVQISFQQELRDKYYFKVVDPKSDSVYDVYVNKTHPKVQMIRKGGF